MKPIKWSKRDKFVKGGLLYETKYEIRVDDKCRNGHCDIHLSTHAKIYDKYEKIDGMYIGACRPYEEFSSGGELFEELSPKFEMVERMNGLTTLGMPMYPRENGYHYFKEKEYDYLKEKYRLTEEELQEIKEICVSDRHFAYLLKKNGVLDRWKKEADECIKFLEEYTGQKFEDYTKEEIEQMKNSPNRRCIRWEEDFIFDKTDETIFNPIDERKAKEVKEIQLREKKEKRRKEFEAEYEKQKEFLERKLYQQRWLVDNLNTDNYFYHFYRGEGSIELNWVIGDERLSEEQIEEIKAMNLPEHLTIKVKERR